jgi:DNA-binding NtrC family response regulator
VVALRDASKPAQANELTTHRSPSNESEISPSAGTSSIQLAARPAGPAATLVGQSMAEVERRLILDTLDHTLGNRTQAATILGISIRTLRNKLLQYHDEGVAVTAPIPQFADRR